MDYSVEHLVSFGTKFFMNGSVELCVWGGGGGEMLDT